MEQMTEKHGSIEIEGQKERKKERKKGRKE
jgi:hypothetical protein